MDAGRGLGTGLLGAGVGAGRSLGAALGHLGHAVVRLARGEGRAGLGHVGHALVRVAQTPVDAPLLLGGRLLAALQVLTGLEPPGRRLTERERTLLEGVFGSGVDLDRVRIKEGRVGVLGVSGRAFALGSTVYVPRGRGPLSPGLLVHELTHVWQYQHGGTRYLSAALWAQFLGDGYDWRKGLAEGRPWEALNPEQQAALLEHAFEAGALGGGPGAVRGWTAEQLAYVRRVQAGLPHGVGAAGATVAKRG
ncbi:MULTISPECIES: DUF4157 domain-containing protein [Myxococcaceae]|uniref:eCIS core domain-containing protein n=1 Tax=Myxococcaceae TaxID=31 RepID=UPI00188E592B|nr:DUF4157 domain-containing protein [Simulacricoccus sp. 17bor-14]